MPHPLDRSTIGNANGTAAPVVQSPVAVLGRHLPHVMVYLDVERTSVALTIERQRRRCSTLAAFACWSLSPVVGPDAGCGLVGLPIELARTALRCRRRCRPVDALATSAHQGRVRSRGFSRCRCSLAFDRCFTWWLLAGNVPLSPTPGTQDRVGRRACARMVATDGCLSPAPAEPRLLDSRPMTHWCGRRATLGWALGEPGTVSLCLNGFELRRVRSPPWPQRRAPDDRVAAPCASRHRGCDTAGKFGEVTAANGCHQRLSGGRSRLLTHRRGLVPRRMVLSVLAGGFSRRYLVKGALQHEPTCIAPSALNRTDGVSQLMLSLIAPPPLKRPPPQGGGCYQEP